MSAEIVATGAEDDGRKFVGTVDLTPTWRQVAGVIIAGLENGTPEGKRLAREELYRLADFADGVIAERKGATDGK